MTTADPTLATPPAGGPLLGLTLRRRANNWKDAAAGWHAWDVSVRCPQCGATWRDTVSGTEAGVRQLYRDHPHVALCEPCGGPQ